MFEHVGVANYPAYFKTINRMLKPGGLYLHHAIALRSLAWERLQTKKPQTVNVVSRYIFPGGQPDHLGMSIANLERYGFEVHDVEAWREHYARTTRLWHDRLSANRVAAEREVGAVKTRLWIAYLAGVSMALRKTASAFFRHSLRSACAGHPVCRRHASTSIADDACNRLSRACHPPATGVECLDLNETRNQSGSPPMIPLHRTRLAVAGGAAVAAFCAALAGAPAAQEWPSLYADAPTGLVIGRTRSPRYRGCRASSGYGFATRMTKCRRGASPCLGPATPSRSGSTTASTAPMVRSRKSSGSQWASMARYRRSPTRTSMRSTTCPRSGAWRGPRRDSICSGLTVPLGTSEAAANLPPP